MRDGASATMSCQTRTFSRLSEPTTNVAIGRARTDARRAARTSPGIDPNFGVWQDLAQRRHQPRIAASPLDAVEIGDVDFAERKKRPEPARQLGGFGRLTQAAFRSAGTPNARPSTA